MKDGIKPRRFFQSANSVLVKDYKTETKNFCYSKKYSLFAELSQYKINPGSLLPSICLLMKPQNLS
jgi:hypothetical protein